MKKSPLVSVIIPTKNSRLTIKKCLESIKNQSYKKIELIVVDNNSTDDTKKIAWKYTKNVFNRGPERSAQRNYGASKSRGAYLLFVDSDMVLSRNVVKECVEVAQNSNAKGIVIPEKSIGVGFWARCKALEREFYVGVDWMEAARFYEKKIFDKTKGFNEKMISGEDWDLSQRVGRIDKLGRIKSFILHDEGNLRFFELLKKKYYYAKNINKYKINKSDISNIAKQTSVINRYGLFLSKPGKLLNNPIIGLGMILMKTSEFISGGMGIILKK